MIRCTLALIAALLAAAPADATNTDSSDHGEGGSEVTIILRGKDLIDWSIDGIDKLFESKTTELRFHGIDYIGKPVGLSSIRGYIYPITYDPDGGATTSSDKDAQVEAKKTTKFKPYGFATLGWEMKLVATRAKDGDVDLRGVARYIAPLDGKGKAYDGDLQHIPGTIRIDLDDKGRIKVETEEIDLPGDYSPASLQEKLHNILHSSPEWTDSSKEENLSQAFAIVPSDHAPEERIAEVLDASASAGVRNLVLSRGPMDRTQTMVIQMTGEGLMTLAGEKIDLAALEIRLKQIAHVTPDKTIIILPSSSTDNQQVGDVLKACLDAGVRNLGLGWPGSNLLSPKTEDIPAFQTSLTPISLKVQVGKDYDFKLQAGDDSVQGTIRCELVAWPMALP